MDCWDRSARAVIVAVMGVGFIAGCANESASVAFDAAPTPMAHETSAKPALSATVAQTRAAAYPGAAALHDVRVMSFNCRVSTLFDLHNTWGLRKRLLVDTIQNFDPDLLGTQELLAPQADYLRKKLEGYGFVGVGRDDGRRDGEMCGVFFRSDKFEKLDAGHFWLSESPSKPGSKGWGAWFPRVVTWVKLRPRNGGETFCWFNTHLDAFSSRARLNGAKLLRMRMASIAGAMPVLVTGDFNADAGSDPYQMLTGGASGAATLLNDTFRAAGTVAAKGDGTRHAFRGGRNGPRIDWILACNGFRTIDADIDHTRSGLIYPSDHFPVTAVLRPTGVPSLARME